MTKRFKYQGKVYISGADLRKMRLNKGLTTVKMAKVAMVKTRKTYENWERDMGSPDINQLILMVQACDMNPAEFIQTCITRESGITVA